MAKKKDKKAKKSAAKPAKKAAKPAAKKAAKPAKKKPAPAKAGKKPVAKKAVKPAKKVNKPKPQAKKVVAKNKPQKTKKAEVKTIVKAKPASAAGKEVKKPTPKKADLKSKKAVAHLSKEESKKAKPADSDLEGEELDVEGGLLEIEPVEGAAADDDDELIEEVEVEEKPKKGRGRGRGRGKKEGKKHYDSEDFVRKQIVKIDLSRPLIKKPKKEEPAPYVNNKDKRSRYSDKELGEFKEIILTKLNEAKVDYELLKQTLTNTDNHGTDDTSPTFKLLEDGSDMLSKEEVAQLASRQEKYIVNLQNALVRIQNKTYGICRVSGKLIPKERLRSVPHATLSIDAKLSQYN